MNPVDPELEALRRKIDRIEADLSEAKQSLARLETSELPDVGLPPILESTRPAAPPVEPIVSAPDVATPPRLAEPVALPRKPSVRDWLMQHNLWPPVDGGNVEVRLAAWWTTRLGALLAVIGVVFFAVYVSRNTTPWVKLSELIIVALALGGAGLWLERSVPKFARLVVGLGLALLYFASVAAHAIPATRVIADPVIALVVQLLVVAFITGFALWRRSENTATLAVVMGYGTTLTGCYAGLDRVVLWSALGLAAMAVAVKLKSAWRGPSIVAVPLMYASYGAYYYWSVPDYSPVSAANLWLPLLAAFVVFWGRDAIGAWKRGVVIAHEDRLLQNLNSSLMISVGWLVTWHYLPDSLETFYFGMMAILLLVAWGWRTAKQADSLVVVTATQASAMLALGLVTHFQGHLTALVLLAQVAGMLVVSRLSGMRGLRVIVYLVWTYSLYLFLDALGPGDSVPAILSLLYLGLSAAILSFDQHWNKARAALSYFAGALLGIGALGTQQLVDGTPWKTVWIGGVALTLCAAGWPARAWRGAGVAAGIAVLGMFMAIWRYPARAHETWEHWTNGTGMLLVVVLIALFWDRVNPQDSKRTRWWRGAFVILASLALEMVFWKGLRHGQDVACAAATAVILLAVSPWTKRWPLAIAGLVGLAFGLYLHRPFEVREGYPMMLLAAALAWVLPVIWHHFEKCRTSVVNASWRRSMAWWQAGLATWILLLALRSNFDGALLYLFTAMEAVAIFMLAWKLKVKVAWPASSVVLLFGAWWTFPLLFRSDPSAMPTDLALNIVGILSLIAALLALPLAARSFVKEAWGSRNLWGHGLLAMALLFGWLANQSEPLSSYATVGWGLGAIVIFGLGLFLRARAYRLIGLLGLVLCVPRVFLVDLDATLHRIIAFVVLGGVLLWVGFSYHRFRHLVTEQSESDPTE